MEEKRIESVVKIYNSLVTLLHNILIEEKIDKEQVFYSLFGIIVLELIINKEDVVKLKEGIIYESVMSDDMLENILMYLKIENIDESLNGATIYSIIRNKLAHGDFYLDGEYLVFNVNDKDCKVLLKQFVYYYIKLMYRLNCRIKTKEYRKERLSDRALGKFNKIIRSDKDIDKFLNLLSYKEFTFRRLDNKELLTEEKIAFDDYVNLLYENNKDKEELCDIILSNYINKNIYEVDIKTKNLTEYKEERYKDIKKIIKKFNKIYNKDDGFIDNIIFKSAEDIYKVLTQDYERESIKYGIAMIKEILNSMIQNGIYDFDEFIYKANEIDPFFVVSLPMNEIIVCIVLSLIYFDYCYPLEKLYRSNKTLNNDINNFNFNNLDLSEVVPETNKLYDSGINNAIKQTNDRYNSLLKNNKEFLEIIKEKETQKNNIIKKCEESPEIKENLDKKIKNLENDIYNLKTQYNSNNILYLTEEAKLNNLKELFKDKNMNFYNYTIINGIRNSIAHGNIKCKNIVSSNLKDIEIEFLDIHKDEIQFKLNIKLYNLFSLIEAININPTSDFLLQKKLKPIK